MSTWLHVLNCYFSKIFFLLYSQKGSPIASQSHAFVPIVPVAFFPKVNNANRWNDGARFLPTYILDLKSSSACRECTTVRVLNHDWHSSILGRSAQSIKLYHQVYAALLATFSTQMERLRGADARAYTSRQHYRLL